MSSTIKIKAPAMPEPEVIDRHLPTGITLRGFTKKQLAARDAQWQEMVGPVVEALQTALEYIDAELRHRKELYEPYGLERKWASEQRDADAARAALSAITEE